nr:nucleotidyl transferase AbiEii/AbiGii toxin family protein [Tetragenococcus halophilus]
MLERVLERLSRSDYRENFIIKGGFLIGSMIGMENRTTKDIDATITGITLKKISFLVSLMKYFKTLQLIIFDLNLLRLKKFVMKTFILDIG